MKKSVEFPKTFPVTCHTDHVGPGSTFVVVKGMKTDGAQYISLALEKGAKTIVIKKDTYLSQNILRHIQKSGATLQRVHNPRRALAYLSARAHNFPARKLQIIGITGTKGKTTTACILNHMLQSAGYKTALLSTVEKQIDTVSIVNHLTTPQPDFMHVFFDQCLKVGVEIVVMEVAAQALSLHRVFGIEFDGVIFTNFSQEHGEFYATQEDYFRAKCQLLGKTKDGAPIFVNADDDALRPITEHVPHAQSFSLHSTPVQLSQKTGIQITVEGKTVECPALLGTFNAYNLLAAFSMARSLGISLQDINKACKQFSGIPGRLELHTLPNGARCFIDKAHNPSSFEAVLSTLRGMTDHLVVVFGAGGERDAARRPMMGAIAGAYSDVIVLTSDDPRSEDPEQIISDIKTGIQHDVNVVLESDREHAIRNAYKLLKPHSILALLGKGPDQYQDVAGQKVFFSERAILKSLG